MSLGHGAKTVTSGLVFAYDMDSIKSYKGPQTTNSATGIIPVYNTETALFTMKPSYEDVYVPQIGWVRNCLAMTMYNDYNGGSGNCCPSPILYYTGGDTQVNIQPSTLYTYAIVYKSTNGYTNPNFMYRYEYGSSGYLTEGGVFSTSSRIHLGNDWYWAWSTFTTQSGTIRITPRCFQYQYATWNKLYVAKVLLAVGDYTGFHPRFWPDLSEAVSSTNSIQDWTGNNTIEVNNLTYNSDGTFSFPANNSYMRFPENSALNVQNPTIEVWVKPNALSQNGFWFEKGTVNSQYSFFQEGSNIQWRTHNGSTIVTQSLSSSNISTSNYSHCVATIEGGQKKIYVNGVLKASVAWSSTIPTNANGCSIGAYGGYSGGRSYYYNGNIDVVKVYNRALTAAEVAQNFNATKGRYEL